MGLRDFTKELRRDLKHQFVFLSASLPREDRHWKYFKSADPRAIIDAVSVFAKTILASDGRLVFGGHPTISPLILQIVQEVGIKKMVRIYQSKIFEHEFTAEALRLRDEGWAEFITTDAKPDTTNPDREASLKFMRLLMLEETSPICAVFIGGMEGIEVEFDLFKELYPNRAVYPVGSPGGAARLLFDREWTAFKTNLDKEKLKKSPFFPSLAQRIVAEIEKGSAR